MNDVRADGNRASWNRRLRDSTVRHPIVSSTRTVCMTQPATSGADHRRGGKPCGTGRVFPDSRSIMRALPLPIALKKERERGSTCTVQLADGWNLNGGRRATRSDRRTVAHVRRRARPTFACRGRGATTLVYIISSRKQKARTIL